MKRALVLLALSSCVSVDSGRTMGGLSMHYGAGHASDPSPDAPVDTPTSKGAHLAALYRIYPSFAFGIGLDSTQVQSETSDGDALSYNSYGGAFTGRLDTGRFMFATTAAYYVGERMIEPSGLDDRKLSLSGPGIGAVCAVRIGLGDTTAIEIGPFVRFFYVRARDDDDDTELDERGMSVTSLAYGVSIGIMFGGPPTTGVEDSF